MGPNIIYMYYSIILTSHNGFWLHKLILEEEMGSISQEKWGQEEMTAVPYPCRFELSKTYDDYNKVFK